MNRLQLCQRLRQEVRIQGTGPDSTIGQTGQYKKIVDWIDTAYNDILNYHTEWGFLVKPFSFAMTVGKRDYTPTEAGIPLLREWKYQNYGDLRCYLNVSDEQRLDYLPWDDFKNVYLIGANRTQTGRPRFISIEPDKTINFDYVPDYAYTINGEYFQQAVAMADDDDEPVFPAIYHMIIVYRAMMFYGADEAADEKYSHGQNEYKKILRQMRWIYLPNFTWGAPLA